MKQINFPKLSKEKLLERLEHPNGIARVIIDTDLLMRLMINLH